MRLPSLLAADGISTDMRSDQVSAAIMLLWAIQTAEYARFPFDIALSLSEDRNDFAYSSTSPASG